MMQSSSDLSKAILRSSFQEFTNVFNNQMLLLSEFCGDRNTRLQYLRLKSNGTNKLHYTQVAEGLGELIAKKDAALLENETVKLVLQSFALASKSMKDSEGNVDITRVYSISFVFAKGSVKEKMQGIFQLIDENGDGYLTRTEVEKFFRMILSDVLNVFKACTESPNNLTGFKFNPEFLNQMKNVLPELEKIFDISKLERLVTGAFTADTNHDGLISYDEWMNWLETGHYREEWGTVSLLFESY